MSYLIGAEWRIYVSAKKAIIGSDNGQAITWTNAGTLSNGPLGPNFTEILIWNINIFIPEK